MKKIIYIITTTLLLAVMLGCSSRIYDEATDEPSIVFSINMSEASPKLLALVDQYRVTVLDINQDQIVANNVPLVFNNSTFLLEGQIDSLPAEVPLLFTAEAIDSKVGIIFNGSTTATLTADIVNDVSINLSPVVPLMKSTPRHNLVLGTDLTNHTIDIKIFNVDSLYGVSFRLYYDPAYITFSAARLDTSQNAASVILFDVDTVDSLNNYYKAVTVSETTPNTPIVDTNGDGILVNVDFSLIQPFSTAVTTSISIVPTGLTKTDQTTIPISIIYSDDTVIDITP